MKWKTKPFRAFTLTEILVTLGIIALIAALAFPLIGKARETSLRSKCISNLRQIGMALQGYLQDHDGQFPAMKAMRLSKLESVPTIDTVLSAYLPEEEVFHCPADQSGLFQNSGTSYWWYETVTLKPGGEHNYKSASLESFFLGTQDLSKIPLVLDKEGFHPPPVRLNALYADGHAGVLSNPSPNP